MKLMIASDIHGSAYYCKKMLEAYKKEEADRLLLLGFVRLLLRLVLELAVVHKTADGRRGLRRDLDKVKPLLVGDVLRLRGRHDAELLTGSTDETDLAVPDLLVDLMHVAANTEAPPFFIKIFANKKRAQNILHPYHDTKSPKALFSMIDPFALLGVRTNAPLFFVLRR